MKHLSNRKRFMCCGKEPTLLGCEGRGCGWVPGAGWKLWGMEVLTAEAAVVSSEPGESGSATAPDPVEQPEGATEFQWVLQDTKDVPVERVPSSAMDCWFAAKRPLC